MTRISATNRFAAPQDDGRLKVAIADLRSPDRSITVQAPSLLHWASLFSSASGTSATRAICKDCGFEFRGKTVSIPVTLDEPIAYSASRDESELREAIDPTSRLVARYLRADGLPLALLEALACRVPIVGYESAGVGPLLRRYNQLVIPPAYDDLAKTIRDWAAGSIRLQAPPAEQVPTWREAAAEYVEVLRSAAAIARKTAVPLTWPS